MGAPDVRNLPFLSSVARRNVSWSLFSSAAVAASAFFQMAACGRTLGPTELGRFSLMWAVATLLAITLSLSLRLVLQSRRPSPMQARELWLLRLLAAPLLLVGAAGISFALPGDLVVGAGLLAVGRIADSVRDFSMGLALGAHRYRAAHLPLIVVSAAQASAFVGAVLLTHELVAALAVSTAVTCVAVVSITVFGASSSDKNVLRHPRGSMAATWGWIKLTWPLSATALVGALSSYLPRAILARGTSVQAVGEYTAAASIATLPNIFLSGLAQAPLTVDMSNGGGARLRRVVVRASLYASGVGLGFLVVSLSLGEVLLNVIYGPEFVSATVLLWLMSASVVAGAPAWALDSGLIQTQAYRHQLSVNGFGLVILSSLTVVLVAHMGVVGVGWATLLTASLMTSCKWFVYVRSENHTLESGGSLGETQEKSR